MGIRFVGSWMWLGQIKEMEINAQLKYLNQCGTVESYVRDWCYTVPDTH